MCIWQHCQAHVKVSRHENTVILRKGILLSSGGCLTCTIVLMFIVHVGGGSFPQHIALPSGSNVYINCSCGQTGSSDVQSFWSIRLPGRGTDLQFDTREYVLNNNGVYQLPTESNTLRLLINDTSGKNQMKIFCNCGANNYQTTVYVYGKCVP